MDAYQYDLMKKTLERIQILAFAWKEGVDASFDAMYEIETALDEAGFHE